MYDIIIIGGGAAGLTAGIYSSRAKLKTLLIDKKSTGGLEAVTDLIENYPGFPEGINGFELSEKMKKQALKLIWVILAGVCFWGMGKGSWLGGRGVENVNADIDL